MTTINEQITRLGDNEERIDLFTNGAANQDVLTRFGQTYPTLQKLISNIYDQTGYLVPVAYASGISLTTPNQTVEYDGETYSPLLSELPFTTSGTFETAKFRIIQGVTRFELAARETQKRTVNILDYATLKAATTALGVNGGIVDVPIGRFAAGDWNYATDYMAVANITIRGAKMPTFSANCDRLEGGSIIEGRFNVFADNFHHENIGYDLGKYVMDTYYPAFDSHTANHPNGYTWDAFAFGQPNQVTPLAARKNYSAKNIRCLLRDSLSYGHAVLQEAFIGGNIDNVVGMYGLHAHVIKASKVDVGFVAGYGASVDNVIVKSDTYAVGGDITALSVITDKAPPNTTPWSTPAQSEYGLLFNPATANLSGVRIAIAKLAGATRLIGSDGDISKTLDNVKIDQLELDGTGTTLALSVGFLGVMLSRIRLGKVTISNTVDGIAYQQGTEAGDYGSEPLVIDSLSFSGVISGRAIQAIGYGRISIDTLRANGVIGTLYAIDDTARVFVGAEDLAASITTKWGLNAPSLASGWAQIPGYSTFSINLSGYGVSMRGLVSPTGSSATVVNLPPYLRPSESIRLAAIARNGSAVDSMRLVKVGGADVVMSINDGSGITGAENFLSLDGLNWSIR